MIERHVPAIGDKPVDHLQLARFERDRDVSLVERFQLFEGRPQLIVFDQPVDALHVFGNGLAAEFQLLAAPAGTGRVRIIRHNVPSSISGRASRMNVASDDVLAAGLSCELNLE